MDSGATSNDSTESTDAATAEGGGSNQTHAGLSSSRELLRNPLPRSAIGSTAEKTTPPLTKDGGEEKCEQVPHKDGERSGEGFDEKENKVGKEDEPSNTSAELQQAEETKNPDDGISKPDAEGEEERDEECIVDHIPDSSTAKDTSSEKVVTPDESVEQEGEETGTVLEPGLCKSHVEDPSGEGYPMEAENECQKKEEGCTGETVSLRTEGIVRESDSSAESHTRGVAGEEAVMEDNPEYVTAQEGEDKLEPTMDEAQGGHSPGKTPSGENQTEARPTYTEKDSKPFDVAVDLPGEMAVEPAGPVSSSSASPPSLTTPPQVTSPSVDQSSTLTSAHSPPPDPITASSLHSPTPHSPSLTSPPSLASPPSSNIDSAPPSLPLATLQSSTDTALPPTSTQPPHATSHPSPLSPSSQIPTITSPQPHSPKLTPTALHEPTIHPSTVTTLPEPASTTIIESPQQSLTLTSSTPPAPSNATSSNASTAIHTLQTGQTLAHIHSATTGDTIKTGGRSISTDSSIGEEVVERVGGLEEMTEQERGEAANESMRNDVEMDGETKGVAGTEEDERVGTEEEEGMDMEVGEEETIETDADVFQSPHETAAPEETRRGEEDMEVDGHVETNLASSSSVEDKNAESMCGPKDSAEGAEDNLTITDDSHYEGAEDNSKVIDDSQSESLSVVTPVQGGEVSDVERGPVEEERVDDSSAGPLALQPPMGDVTVEDIENDKVDSVDGASSHPLPASSIEQENDEQEKDKAGGSEERDNEEKPASPGTPSATQLAPPLTPSATPLPPPQSPLDSGPSIANPPPKPENASETPVEDVSEDGASHAKSDTQTVVAQSSTSAATPVQSLRQSSGERASVRTLRRRASDSSSPSHGVSPPVRLRRKSSDVPCPQSGTADTEADTNLEATHTPPSSQTVFPSISTALAGTNPSTKPSLTVFGSQVHQTPPTGPETTPTPQVQSSVEPSSSAQGSKAQLAPTHAENSTTNTVGTGAQKPTDTTPAVVVSTAKTTVHVSPSASTSPSPSVSAAPLATTATVPQLPPGYQPVIQVTPSGPVVTLIHTSQLKLASLQLSQQAAVAAFAAVAEKEKAGASISPSPARLTGEEAVASKFESPEKRQVLTGGRPETLQQGSGTSPLTSVQRIAVPKPQTYESTQAVRIHPEQRALSAVAGVGSQTEPTTAGGGGGGTSSSQSDTPQLSQLTIAAVSSLSSPLLLLRSEVNHEANWEKVVPQQLSAPVAHVPVVRRAGSAERVEGGGRKEAESEGTEENRAGGVKMAEKLMVQKAEILGSFGTSGQDDFQPKQISTIQCHTGSSSTTTGTKSPQVAVIPPLVDLTKVTSDPDNGKKDDKSKESSSEKQPVIRRFWTTSWTPLNVNDLEFIEADSKGNLYWYDGGRNMFLSPPHPDHRHKPREADMQLVCKSMVQWTAKLKELRNTKEEQDMKLSHVIKERFAPRVRRVTQRKPKRDQTALIQMINSSKNQQQQQQPSVQQQTQQQQQAQQQQQVQQAFQQHLQMLQQQQHLQQVAAASTSTPSSSASSSSSQAAANSTAVVVQSADGTTQKRSMQVQPSFPQGSILVVPHQHGGFQAVPFLPVFANTAVIMPQGVAAAAGSPQPATQTPSKAENTSVTSSSSSNRAKVDVDRETGKRNSTVDGVGEGKGGDEKSDQLAGKVEGKKEKEKVSQPGLTNPPGAAGLFVPVYTMKTGEQVKLESFDFRSKSVEISGEVPIRAIQVGESGEEDTIPLSRLRELVGDSFSETAGGGKAKEVPPPLGQEVLKSHTSTEVMSAKMLLSLTGSSEVSPLEKDPPQTAGATPTSEGGATGTGEQPVAATTPSSSGTPNSVGRQTPSGSKGARKRKQKPTPSAKPSTSDETQPKEQPKDEKAATAAAADKSNKTAPPAKKRARKTTAKSAAMAADNKNSPTAEKTKGPARPKKGSQKNSKPSGGDNVSSASPASLTKEKGPSGKSKVKTASASVRMEQLKAERGSRPVKEFVIESSSGSDSEESDSSSGTGSTSFSPNSGSSSDSSSDSSSENQQSGELKPSPLKTAVGGRGRGGGGVRGRGGRGGGAKRKGGPAAGKGRGMPKSQSSSSEESSGGEEEEEGKEEAKRQKAEPSQQRGKAGAGKGRRRGQVARGRGREKKGGDPGHIVSIPTDLLESLPPKKRQRKAEQTTDHDSERLARIRGDYLPEGGNLSSFYSAVEVDLSTLSELTESVPGKDPSRGDGTRSKRTCVRVREGISRLEEILGNGGGTSSPPTRSTRGRGRGVGSVVSSGGDSTKKQRRTAYRSQFTQKRRRKRRKPEDEALWQPAHKSTATENRRPIYVFSTDMANAAADAVLKNRYDSIIQFHNAQPKGPGFLRPSKNDTGRREDTNSNDVTRDSSESDDEGEGGGARGGGSEGGGGGGSARGGGRGGGVVGGANEVNKAPKRRSSRLSTSEETPTTKRLRGGGKARRGSDNSKQTRYSRRLRKRQQASSSPPSSPAESANQSSSEEEDESEAESGGSPAPLPVTQRRGGRSGGRGARSRGRGRGGRGRGRRNVSPANSGRRGRAGDVDEKDTEDEEGVEGQGSEKQAGDEEMDTSRNTDQQETPEDKGDKNNESHLERRMGDLYGVKKEAASPHLTSQRPPLRRGDGEEENNYTICHGTPRSKGSRAVDISSPAPHDHLSPQRLVGGSPAPATPVSSVAAHHTQHDIASLGVLPDKHQSSSTMVGLSSGGAAGRGDPMLGATSALHPNSGGATHHHHKEPVMAPNNWPGGLGPQFAHVPGGYYGAGIHHMHYPPHHAAQHIPGANYSYGVYPWGTPHAVGGHPPGDQQTGHLYGEGHESSPQHRQTPSSHASHHPSQHGSSGSGHFQLHPTTHRSATDMGKDSTGGSSASGASSSQGGHEPIPAHDNQHPRSSPNHPPHHSLQQLPGSAGVMTTLPHVQHPSAPAYPRPHPALAPDQISTMHPAAAFSYGFDPSNPAALSHMHQLWQQQQQQMRAAGAVHPTHLPPHLQHPAAAGMWYPHMQQFIQHGGGIPPDDSAKRRGIAAAASQQGSSGPKHPPSSDGLRTNSNRNNNEPALIVRPSPEALLHGTRFPHNRPLPSFQQTLSSLIADRVSSREEWNRTSTSHESNAHPSDSYPR